MRTMVAFVIAAAALLWSGSSASSADLKLPLETRVAAVVKTAPFVQCKAEFRSGLPCFVHFEVGTNQVVLRISDNRADKSTSLEVSVYPAGAFRSKGLVCEQANTFEEWCVVRFRYPDGFEVAVFADFRGEFTMATVYSKDGAW